MSAIQERAMAFFDACETGGGWADCQQYCHPDATFACQSEALADINTLDAYCEWMKNIFIPMPDAHYELNFFAVDEARNTAAASAVIYGTHTGADGPVEPTGNSVAADYVYVMQFEGDRIRHMTKIWNDHMSMLALGWK